MSTLGSFVSLVAGISGRGPGPSWLWMLIAYLALAFGMSYEWYRASRKLKELEPFVGRFRKILREQCDAIILDWEELASHYLNAAKGEHEPKTLPDPMASWWVSSERKVWPYRVGSLQGRTTTFRQSLKVTTIPVEDWADPYMSITRLLSELRKYSEAIGKLQ